MEILDVLSSAKFIASHSKYVKVNEKGVKKGVTLVSCFKHHINIILIMRINVRS